MTGIIITYQINPSSAGVDVTRVVDVRPIRPLEDGGYFFAVPVSGSEFLYRVGLIPKGDRALIYFQPPGVHVPGFGYGPITGGIIVHETEEELRGDYKKFPELPRTRKVRTSEIIPDAVPFVDMTTYDAVVSGSREAFETVFRKLGFETHLRCDVL